jgi:AcrR family transcriptional regulator
VTERYVLASYVPIGYILVKRGAEKNILGRGKKAACEPSACGSGKKTAAQRVFETARELFYRRGVRAVGVDEIVVQAGVTQPSLYRAYASKDELVASCLEASAKEGQEALDAAIAAAGPDALAQVRALIAFYAAEIADPEFRGCPMSNAAVEFPEPGHPGRAVIEECKTEMRSRIVSLTRRLDTRDPELLADGLLLIIEGAVASHHVFGSQGPSAAMTAAADALLEGALNARVSA